MATNWRRSLLCTRKQPLLRREHCVGYRYDKGWDKKRLGLEWRRGLGAVVLPSHRPVVLGHETGHALGIGHETGRAQGLVLEHEAECILGMGFAMWLW